MNNYLFIGQLRLTEGGSNRLSMNMKAKPPATLEPIVSRLGIDIKMEKPSMFNRPEGDQRKQPQRLSFPPVSSPMTRLPGEKFFVSIVTTHYSVTIGTLQVLVFLFTKLHTFIYFAVSVCTLCLLFCSLLIFVWKHSHDNSCLFIIDLV